MPSFASHLRSKHDWYKTDLPWKGNHPSLPSNRNGSLQRFANLQHKLRKTGMTERYGEIIETKKADGIQVANEEAYGIEILHTTQARGYRSCKFD